MDWENYLVKNKKELKKVKHYLREIQESKERLVGHSIQYERLYGRKIEILDNIAAAIYALKKQRKQRMTQ